MIRIAITAGGTKEPMDGVRFITNLSTGQLGWFCLEAILKRQEELSNSNFHIYYIHAENAYTKPLDESASAHISFISIRDAESVYQAVNELTKNVKIDFFIHSMAISDFTYSYAVDIEKMGQVLYNSISCDEGNEKKLIEQLKNPDISFKSGEKIPSNREIIIGLKPTKKVMPVIKMNNPNTFLLGFKLLNGVSEEKLIEVASEMANKNNCDLVLANDVNAIGENNHLGLLVQKGEVIERALGKRQIAEMIAKKIPVGENI